MFLQRQQRSDFEQQCWETISQFVDIEEANKWSAHIEEPHFHFMQKAVDEQRIAFKNSQYALHLQQEDEREALTSVHTIACRSLLRMFAEQRLHILLHPNRMASNFDAPSKDIYRDTKFGEFDRRLFDPNVDGREALSKFSNENGRKGIPFIIVGSRAIKQSARNFN